MNEFKIESCKKENIKTTLDGINSYNLSKVPAVSDIWTPLEFILKDENRNDIGGVLAGIGYWNGLEIKILWVKEEFRNKGIGTKILRHTEKVAKENGAYISMIDTFNFQAEDFYLKNGYKSIGKMTGFPKGHKRVYFSKALNE